MNPQFRTLCSDICHLADVPVPELSDADTGAASFTLTADDVNVSVISPADDGSGRAFVLVDMGRVVPDKEPDVCRSLLSSNFFLMDEPGSARFSRNDATGGFLLHFDFLLGQMGAEALYARVLQLVEFVKGWREDHFMPAAEPPAAPRASFSDFA